MMGRKNKRQKKRDWTSGFSFEKKTEVTELVTADTWDSGLEIIKEPIIKIPLNLLRVCNAIRDKVNNKEFSILVKGRWTDKGYELTEEYMIPEQEVTSMTVDYSENLGIHKVKGFTAVIHSHPHGGEFSSVDDENINSNFECSILYSGGDKEFIDSVLNVSVNNHLKLQVSAIIETYYDSFVGDINGIDNITEKAWTQKSWGVVGNQKGSFKNYRGDFYNDSYGYSY